MFASLDLGLEFKKLNPERCEFMNQLYIQFCEWKEEVRHNIRNFNKRGDATANDYLQFLEDYKEDSTFSIQIESEDFDIDLCPYIEKINEINSLISRIGDFEFSFLRN
jgi:hypothetical protein